MKSARVSAWKSGGGRNCTRRPHGRTSLHLDDVPVLDLPVGLEGRGLLPPDVQLDDGPVAHPALPAGRDPRHAARRDLPRAEVEVRRGLGVLGLAHHVVELDAERVGHHRHGFAEHRRALGRHRLEVGVVDRPTEPRRHLRGRRVVAGRVGRLADRDLVDPIADAGEHDAQQLGPPRADPRAEERRAASLARLDQSLAIRAQPPAVDERRRGDDVDTGFEDPHELVDRRPHRVVDDAVGAQREQRVDVVGGGHAQRIQATQLTDVASDLVGRPRVAAHQLQPGIPGDRDHRLLAHVSGGPLHDSKRHRPLLSDRSGPNTLRDRDPRSAT